MAITEKAFVEQCRDMTMSLNIRSGCSSGSSRKLQDPYFTVSPSFLAISSTAYESYPIPRWLYLPAIELGRIIRSLLLIFSCFVIPLLWPLRKCYRLAARKKMVGIKPRYDKKYHDLATELSCLGN